MQGTKIRLLAGGLLMMATAGYVQMRSSLIQHGNRGRFPTVYSGKC